MEFIKSNFANTTTQIVVDSNTAAVSNLFDRDLLFQYFSSGFNNDATTTTLTVNFDATTTVDRIGLLGHNLQSYTMYFNGATASTFSMTTTADTTVSDYSSNSETSQYFRVTPQACTSVSIDMKQTIVAGNEKAIGHLVLSSLDLDFPQLPPANGYKPRLTPKQNIHKLSDGGQRIQTIKDKFDAQIKYKNISTSFRNSLKTQYDQRKGFIFVGFGTTTAWDEVFYEVIWGGAFDFFKFSDNAPNTGFSGTIRLSERS